MAFLPWRHLTSCRTTFHKAGILLCWPAVIHRIAWGQHFLLKRTGLKIASYASLRSSTIDTPWLLSSRCCSPPGFRSGHHCVAAAHGNLPIALSETEAEESSAHYVWGIGLPHKWDVSLKQDSGCFLSSLKLSPNSVPLTLKQTSCLKTTTFKMVILRTLVE